MHSYDQEQRDKISLNRATGVLTIDGHVVTLPASGSTIPSSTDTPADVTAALLLKLDASAVSAAALTVLDDANVGAMVNTLGGAASEGTGGLVRKTSPALTTPIIDGVTLSALNARQVITTAFAITGAALHAANLTAVTFPAAAIILRAILDVTTVSTGVATVDIGYTAVSATTASVTLLEDVSVGSILLHDTNPDAIAPAAQKAASGKWVTIHEDADTTGLVATLYVQFILA